ncbi:MAG TPA: glycine cleavage system aminomethyltransferase GcvT, partial [Gemmatimonadales bacterium]|nr:glycine cleavage system aminomethyltransferase GcvT [Gemmatimonadales bacterium]
MTTTPTLRRTALYEAHRNLGAKMVPFAGWEMPVQYPSGILAEHHAVRTAAGIFDVSHMGEFEITGPDRNAFVNRITCN